MNKRRFKGVVLAAAAALLFSASGVRAQTEGLNIHDRCAADVRELIFKSGKADDFTKAMAEMHRCERPCASQADVEFLLSCENPAAAAELAEKFATKKKNEQTLTMNESAIVNAFAGCSKEKIDEARARGLLDATYFDPTGRYQRFRPFESDDDARAFKDPGQCVSAKNLKAVLPIQPVAMKTPPVHSEPKPEIKDPSSTIELITEGGVSMDWGNVVASRVNPPLENGAHLNPTKTDLGGNSAMSLHGSVSARIPLITLNKPEPDENDDFSIAIAIDPALRVNLTTAGKKEREVIDPYLEQLNGPEASDSNVERATVRAGRFGLVMRHKVGENAAANNATYEILPVDLFNYEWDRMLATESIGARVAIARLEMEGAFNSGSALAGGMIIEAGAKIGENRIWDEKAAIMGYLSLAPKLAIRTAAGDIVGYVGLDLQTLYDKPIGTQVAVLTKGVQLRDIANTGISLGYKWGEMQSSSDNSEKGGHIEYTYHMLTLDVAPAAIAF